MFGILSGEGAVQPRRGPVAPGERNFWTGGRLGAFADRPVSDRSEVPVDDPTWVNYDPESMLRTEVSDSVGLTAGQLLLPFLTGDDKAGELVIGQPNSQLPMFATLAALAVVAIILLRDK